MKQVGMAMLLFASLCCAQESGDFQPAATNVWGAEYPRIDSASKAQFRVKAPDATKVRLNFWSGPKLYGEAAGGNLDRYDTTSCSRLPLLHIDN